MQPLLDRIKYDGPADGADWIVSKYPSESFSLGSQLVVGPGQEAVFINGGRAEALFGPGTHTLSTGNLPLVGRIVSLPFGGKTPFTAEVYFVNRAVCLDLLWGTSDPILAQDAQFGVVLHLRAHGKIGIAVQDSGVFVQRLVGALPAGERKDHKAVNRYFNGLINMQVKSRIARLAQKQSCLTIETRLEKLSAQCLGDIREEFGRFGVQALNFYIESIKPPPEDYRKIREVQEKRLEQRFLSRACPHCGYPADACARFCTRCGSPVGEWICPSCGTANAPTAAFCGGCGKKYAPEGGARDA